MHDIYTMRTRDMPEDMRLLLGEYPRDTWESHPGFKEKTRHWLGAHQMFLRVSARVRRDTEALLNKDISLNDYIGRLSYFGGNLIGSLHGHHSWEDRDYFPELSKADPRFDAGLAILQQDHAALNVVLDDMTQKGNRVIKLSRLDETQALQETGDVLTAVEAIEALLKRHLSDEEELAVPIILHYRLRG